jgi:hypothetical protein
VKLRFAAIAAAFIVAMSPAFAQPQFQQWQGLTTLERWGAWGFGPDMGYTPVTLVGSPENQRLGCMKLMATTYGQISAMQRCNDPAAVAELAEAAKGDHNNCMLAAATLYNFNRGKRELDRLPDDVVRPIVVGCTMLVFGVEQDRAEQGYNYLKGRTQ